MRGRQSHGSSVRTADADTHSYGTLVKVDVRVRLGSGFLHLRFSLPQVSIQALTTGEIGTLDPVRRQDRHTRARLTASVPPALTLAPKGV